MAIITLTCDWNRLDFYMGLFKARLHHMVPDVQVIELTHAIQPFHVTQAAFILKHALLGFPEGSVHMLLVNQSHHPDSWPMVVQSKGQYIIGWDDGTIDLVLAEDPEASFITNQEVIARVINETKGNTQHPGIIPSFPELSLFPAIAAMIVRYQGIDSWMEPVPYRRKVLPLLPVVQHDLISGQVVYIDSYQNAISNITRDLFNKTHRNRRYEILVKSNHYRIDRIQEGYHGTEAGELLAVFNSVDLLEIAIMMGNASDLLGLEPGSVVKIKFYE